MKFDSSSHKQYSTAEFKRVIDEFFGYDEDSTLEKKNKLNRRILVIDFTPPQQSIPKKPTGEIR